jgi:putative transposase
VLLSQGHMAKEAARQLEIAEQTYYCWWREYGGMDKRQARYLKELGRENTIRLQSFRTNSRQT